MGSTKFLTDAILFGPFRYLRGDRCPSWEAPRTRDKTAFFSHAGIGVDDDLRCWDCAERLAVPDISSLLCSWRKEMNVPSERLPADILAAHYDLLLDLHSQHVLAKPFKWYSTRLERAGPIVVGTLQSMLVELEDWKSALSSADWALLEEEWSHNHYNDDCVKKIDLAVVRSASKGSMASTDSGIAMSLSDDPRGIFAQARNMCSAFSFPVVKLCSQNTELDCRRYQDLDFSIFGSS